MKSSKVLETYVANNLIGNAGKVSGNVFGKTNDVLGNAGNVVGNPGEMFN